MKILLVMPAVEHVRVRSGGDVPRRKMLRFGLLPLRVVAALTPAGHEVVLCDENVSPLDFDGGYDLVGVSFMTACAPRAYEIAAEFRRRGVVTVAGGFHPTFRPQEALEHFDIVVAGEAEGLWPRVIGEVEAGTARRLYRAEGPCEAAAIPIPDGRYEAGIAGRYATMDAVQTGRGCNHACRFCSISAFFAGGHRSRPLGHVLEELRQVRRRGRHFMFADDNIIADRDYAARLFEAMIPLGMRWISQCSIELADDPQLLRLARRAGCRGVFIGVESLDEANLAAVEKGFNDARSYARRIRAIRAAGLAVQAGMIVGMDGDDVGVFERTLRFLRAARIDALQLAILTPQPGTPLFDDFTAAGRIIDRDWSHYDYRHVVMQPGRMSPRQLQDGADWVIRSFYRLDRIVGRAFRTLLAAGPLAAWVLLRVNLTYRYDVRRCGIRGRNPAAAPATPAVSATPATGPVRAVRQALRQYQAGV